MEKLMTLSPAEKSKIENEKQLYVLLRLMNIVEQYHNFDKITKEEYNREVPKLLEKYHGFTRVFPNFNLSQFLKSHDIAEDEVMWAKVLIDKPTGQQSANNEIFIYMQATAKFIQVNDCINMNEQNPVLNQLKTPIQQLLMILKKVHSKIGVQFSQKYQTLQRLFQTSMNNRPITDIMTATQFNELRIIIDSMYRVFELSMKN